MSLIRDINLAICKYTDKNGRSPTSISIGINGKNDLADAVQFGIPFNNQVGDYIYGLRVKWVKRKNYLECLPRKKTLRLKGYRLKVTNRGGVGEMRTYEKIQTNQIPEMVGK